MTKHSKSIFISLIIIALLAVMLSLAPFTTAYADSPSVFINEIHYDNTGTDAGEAVEIAGPAGTDLTGWSLVLYNGNDGASYRTTVLTSVIPDLGGGFGVVVVNYPTNGLQNGSPDGIALVDASSAVVQFLSYEGIFNAVDGPAAGMTSEDIGVSEPYDTPVGFSLQLTGAGTLYEDFTWVGAQSSTFGAFNTGQSFGVISTTFVNEIHYDNTGTDAGEAVEIAGPAGTDLTGWSIVLYNGNDGAAYNTTLLSGVISDQQGGYGTIAINYPVNGIQNGSPDGLALVDTGNNVVQFLSYEGSFVAVGGPADGMTSEDIGVSEAYNSAVGDSLQLTGTGTTYADFTWAGSSPNTFGAINTGQSFGTGPVITPIYDIQYTADPSGDSPYVSQMVTTQGIVTAVFGANAFIQDGTGPWNGLMLYNSSGSMAVGDRVQVEGTVSEYFGMTEIANGTVIVLSSGNSLPAEVLATGAVSQEQWESVFVRVEYATVTNDNLGFGEWLVDDGSGGVRVDDLGSYSYSPDNGDLMAFVQGPLNFNFGDFKIEPRDDGDIKLSACGNAYTPIYTIQGNGLSSPLDGNLVDVEGIVTADLQDGKSGFTIQDASGDGDAATSDGIFVYAWSPDVNVGDHVRVTGYVDEYYDLTEITSVSDLEVCSTGNFVVATPVSLPLDETTLESFEGMLVSFSQSLYISEYYAFGQYGEIVLSTERQFQPTAIYEPGSPEAAQLALDNQLNRIKLDDGRGSQNPDPALHPNGSIFDLSNLFRGGDMLDNVTGVLDYNFGEYKVQLTQGATYTNANPRTASPDPVGEGLKVASFNVLNYFTTIDDSGPICGPLQNQDCRGADTADEFERQRDKIIAALAAIDDDVVGLIEIENHPGDVPTADLVNGLNDVLGAGTYNYIATGAIGTDAIRQAFIYKPAAVTPVGNYAILDSTVDGRFLDDYNRPVLAQTFMDNATGGVFTVAVNHLKSKGSDCNAIGDPDTGDGSGNCNLTRKAAAEALVDWLAGDPTGSGDADFLIIGDLNSYDKEDPIDVLVAGGYTDLVKQYQGEYAYSYVFDGQLGYLDHALANDDLAEEISGVTIWHINADEPSLIDYDMTYKKDAQDALYAPDAYRSSDHDPVIVGLDVCDEIAPVFDEMSVTPDTLWPANHKYVDVTATVAVSDNFDPNPIITLVSVTSNEPDNGEDDGNTVDDIVIVDDFTFQLRAERSGVGTGRIYTITYLVTDACGNSTTQSVTVTVPLSQGE